MIIVQISDLHVGAAGALAFDRIDTTARLRRCVDHILRLEPLADAVVASGDLVDTGTPEEYRRLREALAPLPMPLYLMPGNHDERSALRTAFGDHAYLPAAGTLHYSVDVGPLRLVMLDTVVPGCDGGALDPDQLQWLAATLAGAGERRVLLFMHHPPIVTGIPGMDDIALGGADRARLMSLVAGFPAIERIACGHVHRKIESRWAGTVVSVCPSTAYQIRLSLCGEPLEPSEEPSYCQVHYWNGAELVTHTVAVGVPA